MPTQKKPRQSLLLPTTTERHGKVGQFEELIHWLWHCAPIAAADEPFDFLRMYISLVCESILPPVFALEAVASLSMFDLPGDGVASFPAQRGERSGRNLTLTLGQKTRLAVYCALSKRSSRSEDVRKALKRIRSASDISQALTEQLERAKKCSAKGWDITVTDIKELSPFIAIRNGAMPFHFSVLSGRIRPVSQDPNDPYQITGIAKEPLSHLLRGTGGQALSLRCVNRNADRFDSTAFEPPPNWVAESRLLLREMCDELKNTVPRHCNTPRKRDAAIAIFAKARARIPDTYPKSCVTRMAIDFAERIFVDRATVAASTVRSYLSRCITSGLLTCEGSFELGNWDPDDFFDNVEERINDEKLSTTSKAPILNAYGQFLRFVCPRLRLPTVSLADLSRQFTGGAGQWRLISPHAIDQLLSILVRSRITQNRQIAITIALAFYAGLRAGEVQKLTLSDVLFNDQLRLFEIEILSGKSANSRRRVPLHALAPEVVLDLVRDEVTRRREQFPSNTRFSKIAFLGPKEDRHGYSYHSLSSESRKVLKAAFGESANIHLLRHSACSILFVRWYAIRFPDVLDDHRDRSHEIYQPEQQARLARFFDNMPGQEGDIRPYDLVVLTKVTGHSSPRTMFVYYIHTYSLVHRHAVERVARCTADEEFTDREIAALVPGMRSSASRARLAEKTIRGICQSRGLA